MGFYSQINAADGFGVLQGPRIQAIGTAAKSPGTQAKSYGPRAKSPRTQAKSYGPRDKSYGPRAKSPRTQEKSYGPRAKSPPRKYIPTPPEPDWDDKKRGIPFRLTETIARLESRYGAGSSEHKDADEDIFDFNDSELDEIDSEEYESNDADNSEFLTSDGSELEGGDSELDGEDVSKRERTFAKCHENPLWFSSVSAPFSHSTTDT